MRGSGFDQRVLQLNRDAAAALCMAQPCAELFELLHLVKCRAQCDTR